MEARTEPLLSTLIETPHEMTAKTRLVSRSSHGVGVHISRRRITAVELSTTSKGLRIRKLARKEFELSRDSTIPPEAIADFFRENHLSKKHVVTCLAATDCVFREMVVPFARDDQLRQTVKFESEAHLPTYDIETLIVDYHVTATIGNQSKLLVAAVPKDKVSSRLEVFRTAGIEPVAIDLDLCALFNALSRLNLFAEAGTVLLVAFSNSDVYLLVIEDSRLKGIRTFRIADNHPFEIPVSEKESDAQKKFRTKADLNLRESILKRLSVEVPRMLLTAGVNKEPGCAVVVSNSTPIPDMERAITERFGVPTHSLESLLSSLAAKEPQFRDFTVDFVIPFGLALKSTGYDRVAIDFRQEEYRYARGMRTILFPLLSFLFLITLAFGMASLYLAGELDHLRTDHEAIIAAQKQVVEKILKNEPLPSSENYLEGIRSHKADLLKTKGIQEGIPKLWSASELWAKLFAAIPRKDIKFLTVRTINIEQRLIQMSGLISSGQEATVLEQAIRKRSEFSRATVSTQVSNDQTTYTLRIDLPSLEKEHR